MTVKKLLHPDYITPAQYAKLKGLSRLTVWNHINDDKIEVYQMGMNQDVYLDYAKYKDHHFDLHKRKKGND